MVIKSGKNILEVPSYWGSEVYSSKAQVSLEDAIKTDFGKEGLARFRAYNVEVTVPINDPVFRLKYDHFGKLQKSFEDQRIIGKVYELSMFEVDGISADNVRTMLTRDVNRQTSFSITLDLNPAKETARYLKMLFRYV